MKPFLQLVAFILAFAVTGCATKVWYQPGKTESEIRKDWAESQLAGVKAGSKVHQPFVLDSDIALGLSYSHGRDVAAAEKKISRLTMQSKGYQLVPLSAVPTNAAYLKP